MLRLKADLHTHSVASGHAYSTIGELAAAGRDRGLEMVAVTDHGPSLAGAPDLQYFGNLRILPCEIAGVRLLTGVEANTLDSPNGLDLPDRVLTSLDIVGVGLHPVLGVDPADRASNTAALVRALASPLVDVITHPARGKWLIDVDAIVATAAEAGVAVEVNNHSFRTMADTEQEVSFLQAALEAGCVFSISSDAHYETRVGVFADALEVAEDVGIPFDRIVSRDAESVRAFLLGRRPRPHMDGRWDG